MAVYVDDMRAKYRGMLMSHMLADTSEELLAMADTIGVARRWIQHAGKYKEHFDVSETKRLDALKHGAIPITMREMGMKIRERRLAQRAQDAAP